MEGSTVTSIITGVLTFLGGSGFVKLVDFLRENNNKKYLAKLTNNLQDLSKIYKIMSEVIEKTSGTRVVIMKASNGGGIPKPGSEMFLRILYSEVKEGEDDSNLEKYDGMKLDGDYVDMLIEMQKNGAISRVTDQMNNSLLKRIFLADGVKYTEIYYLSNNKSELYYCAINTTNLLEKFTEPEKRIQIELAINNLRKIFERYMV
jgi:hypothetical protein